MYCLWCRERLHWNPMDRDHLPPWGWVHENGQLDKTSMGFDGRARYDHSAHPVPERPGRSRRRSIGTLHAGA